MSFNSDGSVTCDKKGEVLTNGGVAESLVISDLDPDRPGHTRTFHFCRDREEDGKQVQGCANAILSARNLAHFNERKDQTDGNGAQ